MITGWLQRPDGVGNPDSQQERRGQLGPVVAVEMHFRQKVAEGDTNEGAG